MLDRLTGLEVFGKVVTTGSFSAAGRALGLSQTMVTKHIAALEARLGVKLFHRSTRKLTITESGRNYLEATERILAELEAADTAAPARAHAEPATLGALQQHDALAAYAQAELAPAEELGLEVEARDHGLDLVRLERTSQRRLGDHDTRLRVDVGGYRERRRVALGQFATKMAEEVKASGVARVLEPMSSADRKIVHDTLIEVAGVSTRSEGEDPKRRVVVEPASAE